MPGIARSVLDTALSAASSVNDHLWTLGTLTRHGVVRPMRPDRLVRIGRSVWHWSIGLPLGYAIGAARHPDRPAIIDERVMLTYREVDQRTTQLGHGLRGLGIGGGTRVGLLCRNHHGLVEAMVGCSKIGADVVLLNTGLSAHQLAQVLPQQSIDVVITDEEFLPSLETIPASTRRILAWHDGDTGQTTLDSLMRCSSKAPLPRRPGGRIIVLTSGTTGTPKGARRPDVHGLSPAATVYSRIPLHAGERALISAPLFHTWGFGALQLCCVLGATVVLRRRANPEGTLADIERHGITSLFLVAVMLQRIVDLPAHTRRGYDHSTLGVIASSGSAIPGRVVSGALREFGPTLYNLYGSTEVSWATIATPEDLSAAPETAGRPPRATRLAILDDNHRAVPTGAKGRILVGNDMLFEGYTNGTSRDLHDGLMPTGDLGYLDDTGRLFIAGRDDDMVVSGGENLYPAEIEEVIAAMPQVREVAVTGVPDSEFGQRLAAYVVLQDGGEAPPVDANAVREHVRTRLARFSIPRDVVFLDQLPRNATGKILKRELPTPHGTDPQS